MLNHQFPPEIGIEIEGKIVSDDLSTYKELGLPVHPDFNILGGALLFEFLKQPSKKLSRGSTKKLTIPDVSNFLADKLLSLTTYMEDCRNLVIEIGGIITDHENIYIPAAIETLGFKTGIIPEIVILSCLEYSNEFGFPLKTQGIRYAVREARRKYSLPIKACFVRRRYVPGEITDEQIKEELVNIAFETQIPATQIIYEPNFSSVYDLKKMVAQTGIFKDEDGVYLVSACLLSVPCRYDGSHAKVTAAPDHLHLFKERGVIAICPEFLAELAIPRGPFEIVGGNGYDVLDGNAKVMSDDGNDYTRQFIGGAQKALETAKRMKVIKAILCDGSPTCGCKNIYDGSFKGKRKPGCGVFTALLKRNGIECVPNSWPKG